MPTNPTLTTYGGSVGPYTGSTLDTNLANIAAAIANANNYSNFLTDTGAANAYVVAFGAGITISLVAGLAVQFVASNLNTTASTLTVNGGATKSIVHKDGSATKPGEIPAGGVVSVIYDGAAWQMQNVFSDPASSADLIAGTSATKYVTPSAVTTAFAFSATFLSSAITVSAGGISTQAHGLGRVPSLIQKTLVCLSDEFGYVAGQHVAFDSEYFDGTNSMGVTVIFDATNINVVFGSYTTPLILIRQDTGVACRLTNARWNLYVRVWA